VSVAIEVTKLVWDVPLPSTQKLVLVAMADFASGDGTNVFPGTARLARITGLTTRTIRKARKMLTGAGLLILERESTYTSPANYTVNLEKLRGLVHETQGMLPPERRSPPEADSSPEQGSAPEPEDRGGVNQVPGGGEPRSSKPPIEPPIEPPPRGGESDSSDAIDAAVEAAWERTPNKAEIRFPEKYKATIRRGLEEEHRAEARQSRKNRQHQESIDRCGRCNPDGIVLIETSDGARGERCTHDPTHYAGLEIATASDDTRKVPA